MPAMLWPVKNKLHDKFLVSSMRMHKQFGVITPLGGAILNKNVLHHTTCWHVSLFGPLIAGCSYIQKMLIESRLWLSLQFSSLHSFPHKTPHIPTKETVHFFLINPFLLGPVPHLCLQVLPWISLDYKTQALTFLNHVEIKCIFYMCLFHMRKMMAPCENW